MTGLLVRASGERLTTGGWLGLHPLHPLCLITNPAVSLVHKVSQVINDFWEATRKKAKEIFFFFFEESWLCSFCLLLEPHRMQLVGCTHCKKNCVELAVKHWQLWQPGIHRKNYSHDVWDIAVRCFGICSFYSREMFLFTVNHCGHIVNPFTVVLCENNK